MSFYTPSGTPSTGSPGDSAPMRAEFSSIQAAFAKLPTLAANQFWQVNSGGTAVQSVTASALAEILKPDLLEIADSATNTTSIAASFTHTTDATPAVGIGTAISFITETTAGNHTGAVVSSEATDVGSGSEDFKLLFKLMTSGSAAATKLTLLNDGRLSLVSGGQYQINGVSVLSETTLGSNVVSSSLTSLGTIGSLVATTADINGGTIDGVAFQGTINNTVIGGSTAAAGSFTELTAVAGGSWTGSGINLASGDDYKINGVAKLGATQLGAAVVSSSLTSVGTISTGVWQGTAINQTYLVGQSGTNTGDEVDASDSVKGIVELATQSEVDAGTSTTKVVTADTLEGATALKARTIKSDTQNAQLKIDVLTSTEYASSSKSSDTLYFLT